MEENKTKELINVFSNTYELICQAAHILDHESMTKVCQHDEDFQNRVLDLIVGICRTRAYTEVEFQDWSQYEEGKSSNGGCYMFSEHIITASSQIFGIKNIKHPRILSIVLYVDVLKII